MSSSERKKLRDRRAQQNLRDKKLRYTTQLEGRVAYCERHHGDEGTQHLLQLIKGLRSQNDSLLRWRERLLSFVNSSPVDAPGISGEHTAAHHCTGLSSSQSPHLASDQSRISNLSISDAFCVPSDGRTNLDPPATNRPPVTPVRPSLEPHLPSVHDAWKRLPLHEDDFADPTTVSCPWLLQLEQIIPCPDIPSSPLDILYGSKTNVLADLINKATNRRPMRDPERLALGWLVYLLTRWLIAPSPTTYENLPVFLRPTTEQLEIVHPMALDFPPWPGFRANLVKQWYSYRDFRDDLFGMLSCCSKVRWPWGEPILERDEANELRMKPEFYKTFMSESGWGLTPEFIARYPQLLVGVDVQSVIHEVA
ncbi:hypothetical protein BJX96DRAFT_186237 [Aspergillus floccosus]